jgi:hypothetical protein
MRTPAEDAVLSAFIDAATSDADPGYPHEGRPAVIVGTSDFDMLIEPIQLGRFARLRNELVQRIPSRSPTGARKLRPHPTSLRYWYQAGNARPSADHGR